MEEKVTIENVLKEYEKYLLSRLIDKEYDFENTSNSFTKS